MKKRRCGPQDVWWGDGVRELRRAGSLHAGSGDLGRGGLGELVVKGAELQDSGRQYREGAGLNGEGPGKGGAAGSERNGEALGASLARSLLLVVTRSSLRRSKGCSQSPIAGPVHLHRRVSWRKVESERGRTHVRGSRWHSLIATRHVPPT